ncbi:hypothetical protein [Mycobacterium kiyosense]
MALMRPGELLQIESLFRRRRSRTMPAWAEMRSGLLGRRGQVARDRQKPVSECFGISAGDPGVQESHVGHGLVAMLL